MFRVSTCVNFEPRVSLFFSFLSGLSKRSPAKYARDISTKNVLALLRDAAPPGEASCNQDVNFSVSEKPYRNPC